ncbi:MAG: alpha-amylase family glycosyl hydrolase [Muribaculaceae bacterium]|nr:alpha-amylase family glycosyl hydrolase [Muribaculaceae bacterium]
MNFIKSTFLALALCALPAAAANSYGIPQEIPDGNILHCFDWSVSQVKEELPAIAEAGFGAVQLSPMQGNCANNAEWYYAYLPYDFAIRSGGVGNKAQLKSLCQEADKYGIKIIVDVVANHINGSSAYRAAKWNDTKYWHSPTWKGINYNDRYSITHNNLGEYPDMNSEHADVRAAVAAFIQELKDCGVKGIRWDAAKHIGLPSEGCQFWPDVTLDGLWHYGEILDGAVNGSSNNALMLEYTKYISVTDTPYSNTLLNAIRGGNATTVSGGYNNNGLDTKKLVYWAESHDTYANDGGATKNVSQAVIDRAWALSACRAGATSLYLSRPFEKERTKIKMGVKGSTNFKSAHIAEVNHLHNAMGDTPEYMAAADGVTVVTRAGGGACIVVGNGSARTVSVPNGGSYLPAGTYTDRVAGGKFTVTASTISGPVGSSGIAVLYDETVVSAPRMEFTPGASSFKTPTLTVKAELVNAVSGTYSINGGTAVAVSGSGATFTVGEGITKGDITVSWEAKAADGATRTGSVVYTKIDVNEAPANMPAEFYVIGEVNKGSWSPSKGVAMERKGALFTVTTTVEGYFSFAKKLGTGSDWNSLNVDGNRYGVAADATIALGQPVYITQINDPKAIGLSTSTPKGEYTITVDWNDMSVTLSKPTGIDAPEVTEPTDAPVEYYTLQGIRVAEPLAPGLYIRRQGATVSKILVK